MRPTGHHCLLRDRFWRRNATNQRQNILFYLIIILEIDEFRAAILFLALADMAHGETSSPRRPGRRPAVVENNSSHPHASAQHSAARHSLSEVTIIY